MKTLVATTVMAAMSVLLISGCSSPPPAAAAPTVHVAPDLDPAQVASLKAALTKINPQLVTDNAVDNARDECTAILGGTTDAGQLASTKAIFTDPQLKPLSIEEAGKVLEIIKSNGFCKEGS